LPSIRSEAEAKIAHSAQVSEALYETLFQALHQTEALYQTVLSKTIDLRPAPHQKLFQ